MSGDIPLFLAHARVYCDGGKVALAQQLVELGGTESALDEDDDLVELEVVEQLVQLAVLLRLCKLDIVLLETVKCELCLVIDVDLERVLHELLADRSSLLGEGGTEHHNLLLSRSGAEDLLNVTAHV